jgi:hypothetical protein
MFLFLFLLGRCPQEMGISLPCCYTVYRYRNGTAPIADSRHGGGVNEVVGVGIKARVYIYVCTCIYMSM